MRKFCKYYFSFYCKWYIWKLSFKGFPQKKSISSIYNWEVPVVKFISSKTAGSMSAVLVEVSSLVGASQVFFLFYYLLYERLFGGKLPLVTVS